MSYMSGAEALIASLAREGVEVIFGIPGVQVMGALDAIYRNKGIRWITTRHEQAAAFMAYGYASTTGKVGTALVVPGPGALNTAAAIGTAYATSTPVLLISGQIESYHVGMKRGVLHDMEEQLDVFRTLTKWCGRVSKAEEIPAAAQQAMQHLKTGRPRPVELEVPWDLWEVKAEMALPDTLPTAPDQPGTDEIKRAAELLARAKRPLILAGGGVIKSGASKEMTQLAERLKAPVIVTAEGKGAIRSDHPLSVGEVNLWLNPAFLKADVVLGLGSRLRASGDTGLKLQPDQKLIQIDIDAAELGRNHKIDLGIAADARTALATLLRALPESPASQWAAKELEEVRAGITTTLEKTTPVQLSIIRAIRDALQDDSIVVPDITNIGYWCHLAYPVNKPRTYIGTSYAAPLGYAFPTALGAKIGNPEKHVVALCGDGGFPYAASELATAVQEKINIVVLVFVDGAYGTVVNIQRRQFGNRVIGSRLHAPDFARLAEAFGAAGIKLSHHEQLGDTLSSLLPAERPVLIEIPVPQLEPPWDVLLPDAT